MKKVASFFVGIVVLAGLVMAAMQLYKIRDDIHTGYSTVDNIIERIFLPFIYLSLIFGGELFFSIFIFNKDIRYFMHIIIFFLIQFVIGAILIILHLDYWIDYFRHTGNVQFMLPKYQGIDFLTSWLYRLDRNIGLCLTVSSIVFFIQLYKKTRTN